MKEAMASSGDSSRMCKRVIVVVWALAHLMVTLYVLCLLFEGSTSTSSTFTSLDWLRGLSPYRSRRGNLTELYLANRKAALEFRREAAPLLLMLRVKDIEAEVAINALRQGSAMEVEKTEEEELKDQQVETAGQQVETAGQQGEAAIVDDAEGALQRLYLPPDQCQPEANTDFGGIAVRWGLTFHVSSAAECCKACTRQASYTWRGSRLQRKCNVWVFCPQKDGCPSPDGYDHKFGECWLKQADEPRAVVHNYSLVMREKSMPPMPVLWISGVTPVTE